MCWVGNTVSQALGGWGSASGAPVRKVSAVHDLSAPVGKISCLLDTGYWMRLALQSCAIDGCNVARVGAFLYEGLSTSAFQIVVMIPLKLNGIMTIFRKAEVDSPTYYFSRRRCRTGLHGRCTCCVAWRRCAVCCCCCRVCRTCWSTVTPQVRMRTMQGRASSHIQIPC